MVEVLTEFDTEEGDTSTAHGRARWRKAVEAGSVTTHGRARWQKAVEAVRRR